MAMINMNTTKSKHRLTVSNSLKNPVIQDITPSKLSIFYDSMNGSLIKTLSKADQKAINNDSDKKFSIDICFYAGDCENDLKNNCMDKAKIKGPYTQTLSLNGQGQFVLNFNSVAVVHMKSFFPFSEAIRVLSEGDKKEFNSTLFKEQLGIVAVPSIQKKNYGFWVFYPKTIVNSNTSGMSSDDAVLVQCLLNYGKHLHSSNQSISNNQSVSTKRNHVIRVTDSTAWHDAKDYAGDITTWENCIYTLASDPDSNGICQVYIGEATNPKSTKKTRISKYSIGGKDYIDHTKKEAQTHKFTRFRIDKLADESTEYLHDMQDLAIGIATMLRKECPKGYKLTNSAQGKSFNDAIAKDEHLYGKR